MKKAQEFLQNIFNEILGFKQFSLSKEFEAK